MPAGVVTDVDRCVPKFRPQPLTVGHSLIVITAPPPQVLIGGQAVNEDRQPGGGVRERRRQLPGGQANIAPGRPHGHADGERGHVGPEPIAGQGIERGKGQVPSRRAGHTARRSAAGTDLRRYLTADHACHHAAAPDREVDAGGDGVVDDPYRGARPRQLAENTASDGPVDLLNPARQPGDGVPAQPARRPQLRWRHQAPPKTGQKHSLDYNPGACLTPSSRAHQGATGPCSCKHCKT